MSWKLSSLSLPFTAPRFTSEAANLPLSGYLAEIGRLFDAEFVGDLHDVIKRLGGELDKESRGLAHHWLAAEVLQLKNDFGVV